MRSVHRPKQSKKKRPELILEESFRKVIYRYKYKSLVHISKHKSRKICYLPNCFNARHLDFAIAANQGQSQIKSSRRDNAIRQVWNLRSPHLLHRLSHIFVKRDLYE
jgi:hypothetical protein